MKITRTLIGALIGLPTGLQGQLLVDFNSSQASGGAPVAGNPADPANAAHQETGYLCYHAGHEVAADFVSATYNPTFSGSGLATVTMTPSWPSTTTNTVQQSIGRSQGQADTWTGNSVNLLRDFIGCDARTSQGGNGAWDGTTGTPTYLVLTLSGLPVADYQMTTYHHDVENMNSNFSIEISTDGGVTFDTPIVGRITNSLSGGSPAENEIFGGTPPNVSGGNPDDLTSTQFFNFTSVAEDVVLRFAPLAPGDSGPVHQMFFALNGFSLDQTVVLLDSDGDELPDLWEDRQFGNNDGSATPSELALQSGTDDADNDQLDNKTEFDLGTNPNEDDSDNDNLRDGDEITNNTNPLLDDSDGDTLLDGDELNTLGTNPTSPDTDGDGFRDDTDPSPTDASDPNTQSQLVAFWPLDLTPDGLTTPDLSGNGYDLTLTNMDASNFALESGRQAAQFSNLNQTMASRIHSPGDLLPITQHEGYTISMWVKVNGTGQNDLRIFSESSSVNNNPLFNLGTRNNGLDGVLDSYIRPAGGSAHEYTVGTPLDDTWRHIAVTGNDLTDTLQVYIDGVLDPSNMTFRRMIGSEIDTTSIGGILRATAGYWVTGFIDDVGLWSKVLSPTEIADLAAGSNPVSPTELAITDVTHDAQTDFISLTWNARSSVTYTLYYTEDLTELQGGGDLNDDITDNGQFDTNPAEGVITYGFTNPVPTATKMFFTVAE